MTGLLLTCRPSLRNPWFHSTQTLMPNSTWPPILPLCHYTDTHTPQEENSTRPWWAVKTYLGYHRKVEREVILYDIHHFTTDFPFGHHLPSLSSWVPATLSLFLLIFPQLLYIPGSPSTCSNSLPNINSHTPTSSTHTKETKCPSATRIHSPPFRRKPFFQ